MSKYYDMFSTYNSEIKELYSFRTKNDERADLIIEKSDALLGQLRTTFENQGFTCNQEEIEFFKEIKPKIIAQRIANSMLLDLYLKQHVGKDEHESNKVEKLEKLKSYFSEYQEFYKYMKSGNCGRDNLYFTLEATKNDMITKILPDIDRNFSTGYDMLLANMYAYDILIEKAESLDENEYKPIPQLTWTLHKYDLVELILALHSYKAFNNGKTDLKEVASAIGQIFNMNLNDINRASFSIKNRKKETTKFLYDLAGNLNQIISESNRYKFKSPKLDD